MKINEVILGNNYKCGNYIVNIIHECGSRQTDGTDYLYTARVINKSDIGFRSVEYGEILGVFDYHGNPSKSNPEGLSSDLEPIQTEYTFDEMKWDFQRFLGHCIEVKPGDEYTSEQLKELFKNGHVILKVMKE